jgi:uncharacterized protein YkwD
MLMLVVALLACVPASSHTALAQAGASTSLTASLAVDPADRAASIRFYLEHYQNASAPVIGWTGSVVGCAPGTTSAAFQAAVAERINYFRAMAGVPAGITISMDYATKAQAAALMMSANNSLSHSPPASWPCYSGEGAQGASNSNLALGSFGWDAINRYVADQGASNSFAGHRRWVLHPQTQQMGSGDVPASAGKPAVNALYVLDHSFDPLPALREPDGFVAWPPRGYVPYPVVYARWSFAYAGANFAGAAVTMKGPGGAAIPLVKQPVVDGYGLNTLVWDPDMASGGFTGSRPTQDVPFDVTISNVVIGGQARSFSYRVTVIDPVLSNLLPAAYLPLVARP